LAGWTIPGLRETFVAMGNASEGRPEIQEDSPRDVPRDEFAARRRQERRIELERIGVIRKL
jgi:hypothetical protein